MEQLLVPGDLDIQPVRQRVHHRETHAMETARRLIDLATEFSAGVKGGEDDLEGRFVFEFGMGIDGNAAAVIAHGDETFLVQFDFNSGCLAGGGLVHGVVEDFGHEMMHGALVGAPDVHAGAAANGLEPLQDFDVFGGIVGGFLAGSGK